MLQYLEHPDDRKRIHPEPGRRCLEFPALAHVFRIEHDKEGVAVPEMVADTFLAGIAVLRIEGGVDKIIVRDVEVVGDLGFARPVVVVAVHAGPDKLIEIVFFEEAPPERVAAAPGDDVTRTEDKIERRVDPLHRVDHPHGGFQPGGNRRIAVEVGNDAGRPVLGAGRPEIMFGTADHRLIPVFVHDYVLVVGIRLESRDHHAAFGEAHPCLEPTP